MECGNRLRVGLRPKGASVSGFACRPFSGQVSWRRATSLVPKHSLFFCFFLFLFVSFLEENLFFPPKMGFFAYFQCLPLLLPSFFPSPLSLSLSCYFLSFCLPCCFSFIILFPCVCLFVSLPCSLLLFHESNHIKILN